jgi:hypothetical protein
MSGEDLVGMLLLMQISFYASRIWRDRPKQSTPSTQKGIYDQEQETW